MLINTPNIQNSIFINIKNFSPSISKEKIIPGNLTDHEAIATKTSPTHDPVNIQ